MKILLAILLTFQMSGMDRPKEPFLYGLEYSVASYSICKKSCSAEGVYFISYAIYQDHRKSCLSNAAGSVSISVSYIDQGKRVKLAGNGLHAVVTQEQNAIAGNWLIHKDAGRSVDLSTTFTPCNTGDFLYDIAARVYLVKLEPLEEEKDNGK